MYFVQQATVRVQINIPNSQIQKHVWFGSVTCSSMRGNAGVYLALLWEGIRCSTEKNIVVLLIVAPYIFSM